MVLVLLAHDISLMEAEANIMYHIHDISIHVILEFRYSW